jgi:hypothetical protein
LADLNTSTLFDVFKTDDDLVAVMRKRAEYIAASYGLIDELTHLGEGSTGKYLAPARARSLTINSALRLCEALGLKMAVAVDEAASRRLASQWGDRDGSKVNARRPVQLGAATLKRVRGAVLSELGRKGAAARNAALGPEARRAVARAAARARWQTRQ